MTPSLGGPAEPRGDDPARVDLGSVAIIEVASDGTIEWVSDGIVELTGHCVADLIGAPLTSIIPERMRESHRAAFDRFVATGQTGLDGGPLVLPSLRADGSEHDVRLALHNRRRGDGIAVVGLVTSATSADSRSADLVVGRVGERLQQLIASDRPLRDVLAAALEPIVSTFGWSLGVLWAFDPWVERLSAMYVWERSPGAHPTFVATTRATRFVAGEGFSDELWNERAPWWSDSLPTEPRFRRAEAAAADGLQSGVFVPVVNGGRMIGIIELVDAAVREVGDELVDALESVAKELGRHLAERLRRETEALQRERLELALAGGRLGLWTYHPASGQVTWDAMLEHAHGIAPGTFGGSFEAFVERIHPDDREAALAEIRAAVAELRRFDVSYRVATDDGSLRYVSGSGAPLIDVAGDMQLMIGVAEDVTDEVLDRELLRRRAASAALAADVGRALVGRAPLAARLDQVVNAVVNQLDVALARVWMLPEGETVLGLVASGGMYTHLDGEHGRIGLGQWKIGRIAEAGEPHVTNDVPNDPQISDHAWAEREGIVSFGGFPLMAQNRCVGVLGVFARHELTSDVIESLSSLTDSLAVAMVQDQEANRVLELLEEARRQREIAESLLQERHHVAEVLQHSLLPPELPEIDGFDSAAAYRAGVEEVGGDFYDLFPLAEHRWGFMIGDVCGRGPEAARFTALARHTLRTALLMGRRPASALQLLDHAIAAAETGGRFCTAVCGVLRTDRREGVARLAVAGHPHPLIVRGGGSVEEIEVTGPLLGVVPEPQFADVSIDLAAGDALVLYTDGVIEARSADGLFGSERLREVAAASAGASAVGIVDRIVDAVGAFDEMKARDDMAVLTIRRTS